MSQLMPQSEIVAVTGCTQQAAQERKLDDLGYIVLGRNARNEVQCLATHPRDPAANAPGTAGVPMATLAAD